MMTTDDKFKLIKSVSTSDLDFRIEKSDKRTVETKQKMENACKNVSKKKDNGSKEKEPRRKSSSVAHRKSHDEPTTNHHNFNAIKVYSISKYSSKERLRKKIEQSKENESIQIDWEKNHVTKLVFYLFCNFCLFDKLLY